MSFVALTTAETDVRSPEDDALWLKVKNNFDDLDSRVISAGAAPFVFDITGKFDNIQLQRRGFGTIVLNAAFTPSYCRYVLGKSPTATALAFDIRKCTSPRTPIQAISHQYTGDSTSVAAIGGDSVQSIARFITQISTQSITFAKASKNIQSIYSLGEVTVGGVVTANCFLYNLNSTVDSDSRVGDSITFASCNNAVNDGTFTIIEINRSGGTNVVVVNASGTAQAGVFGTAQLKLMSYNFTNPVDTTGYVVTYHCKLASHTSGANDGEFEVRAVNSGGNNLWIQNASGVAQAGVAGNSNSGFWKFALSGAASTTDYIVGENARVSGTTAGTNDVALAAIMYVNSGGNNLVLNNTSGAVQGGAAGTINTNRWSYAMPTDPSADVAVGNTIYATGHTSGGNDGTFDVRQVNRGAANNIVVYNNSGVAQGGAAGSVFTTRKLVQFSSDQSASYTTASYVELNGAGQRLYNADWNVTPFRVVQINRGGGANYNIVIEATQNPSLSSQANPAGYVQVEMKSIFNTAPTLALDLTGLEPNQNVVGSSTDFIATAIAANTPLKLYVTTMPTAGAEDLTVVLR